MGITLKRTLTFVFAAAMLLLCACGAKQPAAEPSIASETAGVSGLYDDAVNKAIASLTAKWKQVYSDSDSAGYLEIKNTRITFISDDAPDLFEGVDYIVDFVLFSDYYGTAPLYTDVKQNDCVVVYEDGTAEVMSNVFQHYIAVTYSTDFSAIIESISDLGCEYNRSFDLK